MLAAMTRLCETRPYDFKPRTYKNDQVGTVISNAFHAESYNRMRRIELTFSSGKFNVHVKENARTYSRIPGKHVPVAGQSGYPAMADTPYNSKGFVVDGLNFVIISSMMSYTVGLLNDYYEVRRSWPFGKKKYSLTDAAKSFKEFTHSERFDKMAKMLEADYMLRTNHTVELVYRKHFVSMDYAIEPITAKEYCDIERLVEESKQRKIEETLDKYAK